MVSASQLRAGMAIRYEGQLYKVLMAEYHPGQGKMGGVTHARLKNLSTGTVWEHAFRSELKLEDAAVEKQPMDFMYSDEGLCFFMHPETFEQIEIPEAAFGPQACFLKPELRLAVEFVEGQPVSAVFPDVLEVRIAETAPPVHQQTDSVWKTARLENGVEILVPQFIKAGDFIRLDTASLKYIDRVKSATKG